MMMKRASSLLLEVFVSATITTTLTMVFLSFSFSSSGGGGGGLQPLISGVYAYAPPECWDIAHDGSCLNSNCNLPPARHNNIATILDCQKVCAEVTACTYFSYTPSEKKCVLKTAKGAIANSPSTLTGPKVCPHPRTLILEERRKIRHPRWNRIMPGVWQEVFLILVESRLDPTSVVAKYDTRTDMYESTAHVSLSNQELYPSSMTMAGDIAIIGCQYNNRLRMVKINVAGSMQNLGNSGDLFTTTVADYRWGTMINDGQYVYTGVYDWNGEIIKVEIATLQKRSSVTQIEGFYMRRASCVTMEGGYLYFGLTMQPIAFVRRSKSDLTVGSKASDVIENPTTGSCGSDECQEAMPFVCVSVESGFSYFQEMRRGRILKVKHAAPFSVVGVMENIATTDSRYFKTALVTNALTATYRVGTKFYPGTPADKKVVWFSGATSGSSPTDGQVRLFRFDFGKEWNAGQTQTAQMRERRLAVEAFGKWNWEGAECFAFVGRKLYVKGANDEILIFSAPTQSLSLTEGLTRTRTWTWHSLTKTVPTKTVSMTWSVSESFTEPTGGGLSAGESLSRGSISESVSFASRTPTVSFSRNTFSSSRSNVEISGASRFSVSTTVSETKGGGAGGGVVGTETESVPTASASHTLSETESQRPPCGGIVALHMYTMEEENLQNNNNGGDDDDDGGEAHPPPLAPTLSRNNRNPSAGEKVNNLIKDYGDGSNVTMIETTTTAPTSPPPPPPGSQQQQRPVNTLPLTVQSLLDKPTISVFLSLRFRNPSNYNDLLPVGDLFRGGSSNNETTMPLWSWFVWSTSGGDSPLKDKGTVAPVDQSNGNATVLRVSRPLPSTLRIRVRVRVSDDEDDFSFKLRIPIHTLVCEPDSFAKKAGVLESNILTWQRKAAFVNKAVKIAVKTAATATAITAAAIRTSSAGLLALQRSARVQSVLGCKITEQPMEEERFSPVSAPLQLDIRGVVRPFSTGAVVANILIVVVVAIVSLLLSMGLSVWYRKQEDKRGEKKQLEEELVAWASSSSAAAAGAAMSGSSFVNDGLIHSCAVDGDDTDNVIIKKPSRRRGNGGGGGGGIPPPFWQLRTFFRYKAQGKFWFPGVLFSSGVICLDGIINGATILLLAPDSRADPVEVFVAVVGHFFVVALMTFFCFKLLPPSKFHQQVRQEPNLVEPPRRIATMHEKFMHYLRMITRAKRDWKPRSKEARKTFFVERYGSAFDARMYFWYWSDLFEAVLCILISLLATFSKSVSQQACFGLSFVLSACIAVSFAICAQQTFTQPFENLGSLGCGALSLIIAMTGVVAGMSTDVKALRDMQLLAEKLDFALMLWIACVVGLRVLVTFYEGFLENIGLLTCLVPSTILRGAARGRRGEETRRRREEEEAVAHGEIPMKLLIKTDDI